MSGLLSIVVLKADWWQQHHHPANKSPDGEMRTPAAQDALPLSCRPVQQYEPADVRLRSQALPRNEKSWPWAACPYEDQTAIHAWHLVQWVTRRYRSGPPR